MSKDDQLREELQAGKAGARTAQTLQTALGMQRENTSESTRALITHCILEKGWPIGSSNKGYFLINSPEELEAVVASLKQREEGLKKRIAALEGGWKERKKSKDSGGNWPKQK